MNERTVVGFPAYTVSECGVVCGPKGRLKPDLARGGYERVTLYEPGRTRRYMVHLLVAEHFIGPRPDGHSCDHVDFNRRNNDVSNLRWIPIANNNGRWAPEARARTLSAVKSANTVYSDEVALAAMADVISGGCTVAGAAAKHGLRRTDLSTWVNGRRRPHLLRTIRAKQE